MAKTGRPTLYTDELAKEICDAISTIPLSIFTICQMHDHFPSRKVVMEWVQKNPIFRDMYSRAKNEQIHILLEDMLSQTEDEEKDFFDDGKGRRMVNNAALQRKRMRLDFMQWYASKLIPKVYGIQREDDNKDKISDEVYEIADKNMRK